MGSGKLSPRIRKKFPTIEGISYKLLIEAYKKSLIDDKYNLDWKEDQFTNYLINFMRKSKLNGINLDIIPQYPLLKDALPIDGNHPYTLPIIDIRLSIWKSKHLQEYFFEAKNLYENDYNKKVASSYINRYIDTGIENFRISRYYNGSLIGYVLEGGITKIIDKLNIQLTKDRKNKNKSNNHLSSFEQRNHIKDFDCYYESKHLTPSREEMLIKHIFLKF